MAKSFLKETETTKIKLKGKKVKQYLLTKSSNPKLNHEKEAILGRMAVKT